MTDTYLCVGGKLDGHRKARPNPMQPYAEFAVRKPLPFTTLANYDPDAPLVATERVLYVKQEIRIGVGSDCTSFFVYTPEGQTLVETWGRLIDGYLAVRP